MNLKGPACRTGLVSGIVMALLGSNVVAQESLDRGKTPVQLFASHCSVCHKSPRGLAKSGGLFGLDRFPPKNYMISRQKADAMYDYTRRLKGWHAPVIALE